MSSPPRGFLPEALAAATTTNPNSHDQRLDSHHLHQIHRHPLPAKPIVSHIPESTPRPPSPPRIPGLSLINSPDRRPPADDPDSEAETVVLGEGSPQKKRELALPTGNGAKRERERERSREGRPSAEGGHRKKRRRSRSRERRNGSGDQKHLAEDGEYSSDLSSAPSRSSRPTSPTTLRSTGVGPSKLATSLELAGENSRKSKTSPQGPGPGRPKGRRRKDSDEDEDYADSDREPPSSSPVRQSSTRPRRRRSSAAFSSPPPLRSHLRSRSPDFGPQSPSKRGKPLGNQRLRRPPPLVTSRDRNASISGDDYSSSSSRHGSPSSVPYLPRPPQSASRTPGSPISMSHKPKRDTAGRTHLHRACQRGNVSEVENILEMGLESLNEEDNAGYLPIHEACLHGNLDIVKVLVNYGALYDVQSRIDHESPLMDAVENGHVDVVKYLIHLGADPQKRDKKGRTCLDANEENSEEPTLRQEIENMLKGAIAKARTLRPDDERGSVPAEGNSSRDPSVASPIHQSPPPTATYSRRRNARSEQSRKDLLWLDSGKNPMHKLREKAREGDLTMVHALLETGLKPDAETLIGAIKGGHEDVVSMLLAYNAVVDPSPGQGRDRSRAGRDSSVGLGEETPMLAAIGRGSVTVLKYLLENGADPRKTDSRGKSYLEIAKERKGPDWQGELDVLRDFLQKSSHGKDFSNKFTPPKRKSSPKRTAKHRRNSSAVSAIDAPKRPVGRPPKIRPNEDAGHKRSKSVHASNPSEDPSAISDRESTGKKKRRLVSKKTLEEEQEASRGDKDKDAHRSVSSEHEKRHKSLEKPHVKSAKQDLDEPPPSSKVKKVKLEPDDTKFEEAPPLERKPKSGFDSLHHTVPSKSDVPAKRPPTTNLDRPRSPPKEPRAVREKRAEMERKRRFEDRPDELRDTARWPAPKRVKSDDSPEVSEARRKDHHDAHAPKSEQSRENMVSGSRKQEAMRPQDPHEAGIKDHETQEQERHKREMDDHTRRVDDEKRKVLEQEEKMRNEEARRLDEERRQREEDEEIELEANEQVRQKHLTRELSNIQRKAKIESDNARLDHNVVRELHKRAEREAEHQKELRRREELERLEGVKDRESTPDVQSRDDSEMAERESAEKDQEERQRQEDLIKEEERKAREEQERSLKAEQERKIREQLERREREKRERSDREARELAEKEAEELRRVEEESRFEHQRLESERREKEEHERRQREEVERRHAEEQKQLERERQEEAERERKRKAIEEDRKRQEMEKAQREKEARDRKVAEELQLQLAKEREVEQQRLESERAAQDAVRFDALPFTLQQAELRKSKGFPSPTGELSHFVPLYSATVSVPRAAVPIPHHDKGIPMPNGVPSKTETCVINVQVALALGTTDLSFDAYPHLSRRALTDHERGRMWNAMCSMLVRDEGESAFFEDNMDERIEHITQEREKWLRLQPVVWFTLSDVIDLVATKPQYTHLLDSLSSTIEVNLMLPTPNSKTSSPFAASPRLTPEELAARVARTFGTSNASANSSARGTPTPSSKGYSVGPMVQLGTPQPNTPVSSSGGVYSPTPAGQELGNS